MPVMTSKISRFESLQSVRFVTALTRIPPCVPMLVLICIKWTRKFLFRYCASDASNWRSNCMGDGTLWCELHGRRNSASLLVFSLFPGTVLAGTPSRGGGWRGRGEKTPPAESIFKKSQRAFGARASRKPSLVRRAMCDARCATRDACCSGAAHMPRVHAHKMPCVSRFLS
jgi:hypothetical protein